MITYKSGQYVYTLIEHSNSTKQPWQQDWILFKFERFNKRENRYELTVIWDSREFLRTGEIISLPTREWEDRIKPYWIQQGEIGFDKQDQKVEVVRVEFDQQRSQIKVVYKIHVRPDFNYEAYSYMMFFAQMYKHANQF